MRGPIASGTDGRDPPSAKGSLPLSIVLSTYNERSNLPRLVDGIQSLPLPPHEIIVVDDGSTDGTREYLLALAHSDPSIRVILHNGKQTLTPAQCQGIHAANGNLVVVMDADLQHPPELVPALVASLEEHDLVVATRHGPGGSPGQRTMWRGLISRIATSLAKLLVPGARRVSDPVSGYFAFRREVFTPVNPRYRGYKLVLFVLEMCRGRSVGEVPYRFQERANGRSKITQNLRFIRVFVEEALLARRDGPSLSTPPAPPVPSGVFPDVGTVVPASARFYAAPAGRTLGLPTGRGPSSDVSFDRAPGPELRH